jgi:hypothetical protein
MAAQILPIMAFAHSLVWPWMPGTSAVILATASAAAWRHLLVRRELTRAENEKIRPRLTAPVSTSGAGSATAAGMPGASNNV